MKTYSSIISTLILIFISINGFTQDSEWVLFESPENDYRISFPGTPTANPQILNTEIGQLKMNIYMLEEVDQEQADNLIYGVISTEYPDSMFEDWDEESESRFFRGSIDGAVNNVHGKLFSEIIIEMDGYPGREAKVDFRDGLAVIKMRMYLVGNKMYILQTITATEKDFNNSINQFMDSFELIRK